MTNRKMPWIAYEIHNINYVIFLILEKSIRFFMVSYALLFFIFFNFIYLYDFLLQLENHFSNYHEFDFEAIFRILCFQTV